MIVNNEVYDLDLSHNLFAAKMKEVIPIKLSCTPFIINTDDGMRYPLDQMIDIADKEGYDGLTENYEVLIGFSMFDKSNYFQVEDLFLRDIRMFHENFYEPSLISLLDIINNDDEKIVDIEPLNAVFYEISDEEDIEDFIRYANSHIDQIFSKMNEHIKEIDKWFEDRYYELGSIYQTNYMFLNITKPDLLLDFDGKLCGVFRTKLATTYLLANGL